MKSLFPRCDKVKHVPVRERQRQDDTSAAEVSGLSFLIPLTDSEPVYRHMVLQSLMSSLLPDWLLYEHV